MTSKTKLNLIRSILNQQAFEHSGDRSLDILRAIETFNRTVDVKTSIRIGTHLHTDATREIPSEALKIIQSLSAKRNVPLGSDRQVIDVVKLHEFTPDSPDGRIYRILKVTENRTKSFGSKTPSRVNCQSSRTPKWATDSGQWAEWYEAFRSDYGPMLNDLTSIRTPPSHHTPILCGWTDQGEYSRSVSAIARSRRDVLLNSLESSLETDSRPKVQSSPYCPTFTRPTQMRPSLVPRMAESRYSGYRNVKWHSRISIPLGGVK